MSRAVNDVVYALQDLVDPPTGDSPGCLLCKFGEKLIVRQVREGAEHKYAVSHEHITDRSFWVKANEISGMRHFEHNRPGYPVSHNW